MHWRDCTPEAEVRGSNSFGRAIASCFYAIFSAVVFDESTFVPKATVSSKKQSISYLTIEADWAVLMRVSKVPYLILRPVVRHFDPLIA